MWEEVRPGRREGAGWRRRKRHVYGMCTGRVRLKAVGARARAERTENMLRMSVTLDVSKLSGWSNADAFCRVEGRVCDAGSAVRPGRRESGPSPCMPIAGGGEAIGMHGEGPDSRLYRICLFLSWLLNSEL